MFSCDCSIFWTWESQMSHSACSHTPLTAPLTSSSIPKGQRWKSQPPGVLIGTPPSPTVLPFTCGYHAWSFNGRMNEPSIWAVVTLAKWHIILYSPPSIVTWLLLRFDRFIAASQASPMFSWKYNLFIFFERQVLAAVGYCWIKSFSTRIFNSLPYNCNFEHSRVGILNDILT